MGKFSVGQQLPRPGVVLIINHDAAWDGPDVPIQDVHKTIEIVIDDALALEQCPNEAEQSKIVGSQ